MDDIGCAFVWSWLRVQMLLMRPGLFQVEAELLLYTVGEQVKVAHRLALHGAATDHMILIGYGPRNDELMYIACFWLDEPDCPLLFTAWLCVQNPVELALVNTSLPAQKPLGRLDHVTITRAAA